MPTSIGLANQTAETGSKVVKIGKQKGRLWEFLLYTTFLCLLFHFCSKPTSLAFVVLALALHSKSFRIFFMATWDRYS